MVTKNLSKKVIIVFSILVYVFISNSSAIAACTKPSAPGGLSAKATGETSINISWNRVSGATAYKLYRSTSPNGSFKQIYWSSANSYVDSGSHLQCGTNYYYKVIAANNCGQSPQSSTVSVKTVSCCTKPSAPGGLSAKATGEQSISVSWNRVANATLYRIYRDTSPNGIFSKEIKQTDSTSYLDIDTSMNCNTTYYYKILAENNCGQSIKSMTVSAKTLSCCTKPSTPGGLNAKAVGESSINISWNSVSGATGYRLFRAASPNGVFNQIYWSSNTLYTDSGNHLQCATSYYYKVIAENSCGQSAQSNLVTVMTSACAAKDESSICNSPLKNQMKISNPSCEQILDYQNYLNITYKYLVSNGALIQAKMDGVNNKNEIVNNVITGFEIVSMFCGGKVEAIIPDVIFTIPSLILGEIADDEDLAQQYVAGTTNIVFNCIKGAIAAGLESGGKAVLTVSPTTVALMIGPDIVKIATNLFSTYKMDDLTEQMNNLAIVSFYLEEYYKYGGNNSSVAVEYGLYNNSSLWNTINAVATKKGYNNDIWGNEYNVDKIKKIVEGLVLIITSMRQDFKEYVVIDSSQMSDVTGQVANIDSNTNSAESQTQIFDGAVDFNNGGDSISEFTEYPYSKNGYDTPYDAGIVKTISGTLTEHEAGDSIKFRVSNSGTFYITVIDYNANSEGNIDYYLSTYPSPSADTEIYGTLSNLKFDNYYYGGIGVVKSINLIAGQEYVIHLSGDKKHDYKIDIRFGKPLVPSVPPTPSTYIEPKPQPNGPVEPPAPSFDVSIFSNTSSYFDNVGGNLL